MKRSLCIVFCIVLATFIAMVNCSKNPTEPSNPITTIIVTSSPPEAIVYTGVTLNQIDTTPVTFTNAYAESDYYFFLRLEKPGYFPWEQSVLVKRGQTLNVHVVMDPAPDDTIAILTNSDRNNIQHIWRARLDGSLIDTIVSGVTSWYCGWSPHHQYFTYGTADGMVLLNPDQTIRSVEPIEYHESWSHSGDRIVYGEYLAGIYVHNIETHATKEIHFSEHLTFDHEAEYSLNDSLIAFVHHEWGYDAWIRLMSDDGGGTYNLTGKIHTNHDSGLRLHWISDHELLYAITASYTDSLGLYLLDVTNGATRLISNTGVTDFIVFPETHAYAFSNGEGLYYGAYGDWTPHLLTDKVKQLANLNISRDGKAIIGLQGGVHWITLSGKCYHILNTYYLLREACAW